MDKENKYTNSSGAILIVILSFMLILVCSYIVIDHLNSRNKTNYSDTKQIDFEYVDINSELIKTLYNKVTFKSIWCDNINQNLTKDYMLVSDFTDKQLLSLAYSNLKNNNGSILKNEKNIYVKEESLKESFLSIFGNNAIYTASSFNSGLYTYEYNSEEKIYSASKDIPVLSAAACFLNQREDITNAKKYKDKLEITTAISYCNNTECFADFKGEIKIKDVNKEKDKLQKIKYTFSYDKDTNNYYYYSIQRFEND